MMSSKLTPIFLLLALSTAIWGSVTGLGRYLELDFVRSQQATPLSAQLKELAAQVERDSGDIESKLRYASALVEHAYAVHDSAFVMRALDQYKATLELQPEHPQALLGIARICLENSIVEKAVEFYRRYLKQVPTDVDAQNSYALALLQSGEANQAEEIVKGIIRNDENYFPARISLALIYKQKGQLDLALTALAEAERLAPASDVKTELAALKESLSKPVAPATTDAPNKSEEQFRSPASEVTSYFRNHPIIGPKIDRVSWTDSSTVIFRLKDFPINAMPQLAKDAFIRNTNQRLAAITVPMVVKLVDERSELLFEFSNGSDTSASGQR